MLIAAYFVVGLVFAVLFSWKGAAVLNSRAAEGSRPFRLLIIPATTALWPWLGWRWLRSTPSGGGRER